MSCEVKKIGGQTVSGNVTVSGTVESRPAGLTIGGRITVFSINDSTWTKVPGIANYANRNALSIQNTSGNQIKINYDNTTVGYVGVSVNSGNERFYSISDTINIYAKAESGAGTINIQCEEIA
jgi:hypothetical protein